MIPFLSAAVLESKHNLGLAARFIAIECIPPQLFELLRIYPSIFLGAQIPQWLVLFQLSIEKRKKAAEDVLLTVPNLNSTEPKLVAYSLIKNKTKVRDGEIQNTTLQL